MDQAKLKMGGSVESLRSSLSGQSCMSESTGDLRGLQPPETLKPHPGLLDPPDLPAPPAADHLDQNEETPVCRLNMQGGGKS